MKSVRAQLTKRLDDLLREFIRKKYKNRCCKCGAPISGHNSHPAHIVAKGKGASWRRFDEENIILLCFKCHRWWHDNPTESGKWFSKKYLEKDKYLEKYRYGKSAKISTEEMQILEKELKNGKKV